MKYNAIDMWNSPSLNHYGVKGMKWGVRKVVERVGRGVRRLGGASIRVAKATAGGLYSAGSAVRRFKNRRAIKSADPNRILKRVSKMNNRELQDALTRVELVGKIRGNKNADNSFGDAIKSSIAKELGKISAETLRTSVESIEAKEAPAKGINRNAELSISKKEQEIAANRLKAKKDKVALKDVGKTPVKAIKTHNKKAGRPDYFVSLSGGKTAKNKLLLKKRKKRLRDNPADGIGRYKYLYHSDIKMGEDFLAHYGVKGMKWGVRKSEYSSRKGNISVIKKGSTISRISSRADGTGGVGLYGSASKEDNDKWAKELYTKKYSQTFTANKDIKIAGEKQVNKVYEKTFLKTRKGRDSIREALFVPDLSSSVFTKEAHDYFEKNPNATDYEFIKVKDKTYSGLEAIKYIKSHPDLNLTLDYITIDKPIVDSRAGVSLFQVGPDLPATKAFTKALGKAGYTAVSDIRGYDVADNPIIFLNKADLKLTSSKRIVSSYDKDKYDDLGLKKYFPSKAKKERDAAIKNRQYYKDLKYY